MKRSMFLLLLATVLIFNSCVNYVKRGDESLVKDYWDDAIYNYEIALEKEKNPQKIVEIKKKLEEAKLKGAKYYAKKAEDMIELQSYSKALEYANLAFEYNQTMENRDLLKETKIRKAEFLFYNGKELLSNAQNDKAVMVLKEAVELDPRPEYSSVYNEAIRLQKEYHQKEYEKIISETEKKFSEKKWDEAYSGYKLALKHKESEEAKSKIKFCDLMRNAEKNYEKYPSFALFYLKEAFEKGYHKDFIQEKIRLITPVNADITFHNAVVLPIDNNTGKLWDGISTKIYKISDYVSKSAITTGRVDIAAATKITSEMTKLFSSSLESPDCYLMIKYRGFNYSTQIKPNTCNPIFEYTLKLQNIVSGSKDVLSVSIIDQDDLSSDDPIGTYQFEICELLAEEGKKAYIFIERRNGESKCLFGSVFALFLSVKIYSRGY